MWNNTANTTETEVKAISFCVYSQKIQMGDENEEE